MECIRMYGKNPLFSLGFDMVGIVDKVGEGVTKVVVGQEVSALTIIGSYSEYICPLI